MSFRISIISSISSFCGGVCVSNVFLVCVVVVCVVCLWFVCGGGVVFIFCSVISILCGVVIL